MSKGEETRLAIVDQALDLASVSGIHALSIGDLAKTTGMSKSGLFAHFGSKTQLQVSVIHAARERFIDLVVAPALKKPRGEPRVRALFELSMNVWDQAFSGGCFFYAVASELDDQPGAPRDALVDVQSDFYETIGRAARIAIDERHFRRDLDPEQFAFEFGSITSAFHYAGRLLGRSDAADRANRAFDALLERAR